MGSETERIIIYEHEVPEKFINPNRGSLLILLRIENLSGINTGVFLDNLEQHLPRMLERSDFEMMPILPGKKGHLYVGIHPLAGWGDYSFPNIESAMGRFRDESLRDTTVSFEYGIGRTQCNYISDAGEIFTELEQAAAKNLYDNITRWSWTFFNRANEYLSSRGAEVMIQPTIIYYPKEQVFSVKGGEVFVGGGHYSGYGELLLDIPHDQDLNRIELLILEKLIMACRGLPGLLKFNISPQTLIDTFYNRERVSRFTDLIHSFDLEADNVRLELVEKPYEESSGELRKVCELFYEQGISFAADDFGLKSQSHQVVLDLGIMIKEFKLDPLSFRFKAAEDPVKFLDNLAFIDYCKRLADNREADITAEAVEDYETLLFLMEHQIHQFQANIFSGKMPVLEYLEQFPAMAGIPADDFHEIMGKDQFKEARESHQNIFQTWNSAIKNG